MPQFKDSFSPGVDLIYGIGAWISRYIIHLDTKGQKRYAKNDQIPKGEWDAAHARKESDCYAINTFNMAITNAAYALQTGSIAVSGVGTSEYMKAIESTKYGTRGTVGDPATLAAKLVKSNKNLDLGNPGSVCAAAKDLAIRRSSKFGIKYAVENLKGTVHYLLDEIDQTVLLAKSTITNGSGYEKIPICTSEVRYLFRNWGRYGGKVMFWENYVQTSAPWMSASGTHEVGWASYALARMWKFKNKLVGKHQKFASMKQREYENLLLNVEKFAAGDQRKRENGATIIRSRFDEAIESPRDIIRAFHALPHGLVNEDDEPV